MKTVVRVCTLLLSISCTLALSQPTPQQIQQRQMEEERALQHEQEQREQQQRDALQMEKMREIDRQQAEEARQQAEKARAQAITAQENLYLLQQARLTGVRRRQRPKAARRLRMCPGLRFNRRLNLRFSPCRQFHRRSQSNRRTGRSATSPLLIRLASLR